MPISQSKNAVHNEARTIAGKPLDGLRQHVDTPEAVLDGCNDEILHIFALDAFCRGHMSDCFPVTAVERKCNADLLLVITGDREAIGTPSSI